jgi:hypothetical protein
MSWQTNILADLWYAPRYRRTVHSKSTNYYQTSTHREVACLAREEDDGTTEVFQKDNTQIQLNRITLGSALR